MSDSTSTVVVDSRDDLAQALATLPERGTLLLNPGVYDLSSALVVERDVFVKSATGNERDVVLVRVGGTAIFVRGGAPVFEALTVLSPESDDDSAGDADERYKAAIFVSGGAPTFVDCRVSSAEKSGFGVRGEKTSIRLSRCEIRKTGDGGIFLDGGARGIVEDCGVYDATLGCVDVEEGASCDVRRSRLHRSAYSCLSLHNGGVASLVDCEILLGDAPGICVVEASRAEISATKITASEPLESTAVFVDESAATFQRVAIVGPAFLGAKICGASVASFSKCSVEGCSGSVTYDEESQTTFVSCRFEREPLELPSFDDENDDDEDVFDDEDEEENDDENESFDDHFDDADEDDDEDADDLDDDENEDDFAEAAALKERLLEEILGPTAPRVGHAIIPYRVGGALDLYYYPRSRFGGTFFASQELVGPEFDGPSNQIFDAFELAIATRLPCSAELLDESSVVLESDAIDQNDDEDDRDDAPETSFQATSSVFHRILTNLARYVESSGAVVNRFDTLEFPADFEDAKLAGRCFIFDALPLPRTDVATERWRRLFDYFDGIDAPRGDSRLGGARFGVLLAIQVFRDEMNSAREQGTRRLLARLKAAGVYPFSDLDRESVV